MLNKKDSFITKILNGQVESVLGSIFFIILFSVIILQVFSREIVYYCHLINFDIPFKPPVWTEEAARWCWIWMVYITWGALEKNGGHLKAGFLDAHVSKTPTRIITLILDLCYFCLTCFLFMRGILQAIRGMRSTPVTLPFVDSFLFIVLPRSLVFVIIRLTSKIVLETKSIALTFRKEK